MAETIIFASVTLIFILILIQKISVRFLFKESLLTEIDYSFFKITLSSYKSRAKMNKIKPKLFSKIKRMIEFLLRNSEITVSKIRINSQETEPKSFILKYKNLFSLFAATTVYLSKKTKKLNMNDASIEVYGDESNFSKSSFDISITSPLYITLLAATMFLQIIIKNKMLLKARRGKNVRKQNE